MAIRHVAFEDLGVLEPLLEELGYGVTYREAGRSDQPVTDWLAPDLLVVLGGPIGVYDVEDYPWLTAEIAGIAQRLRAGRPTLGLCLGAQLMAAALGAKVYAGAVKEIGWGHLSLTGQGATSVLAGLGAVPVLHWHGDTFDLPQGASLLASTAHYEHQAFAVGRHALALQFHLEVDPGGIEAWLVGHAAELRQAGVSVPGLRAASRALGTDVAAAGRAVIASWLRELGEVDDRGG